MNNGSLHSLAYYIKISIPLSRTWRKSGKCSEVRSRMDRNDRCWTIAIQYRLSISAWFHLRSGRSTNPEKNNVHHIITNKYIISPLSRFTNPPRWEMTCTSFHARYEHILTLNKHILTYLLSYHVHWTTLDQPLSSLPKYLLPMPFCRQRIIVKVIFTQHSEVYRLLA